MWALKKRGQRLNITKKFALSNLRLLERLEANYIYSGWTLWTHHLFTFLLGWGTAALLIGLVGWLIYTTGNTPEASEITQFTGLSISPVVFPTPTPLATLTPSPALDVEATEEAEFYNEDPAAQATWEAESQATFEAEPDLPIAELQSIRATSTPMPEIQPLAAQFVDQFGEPLVNGKFYFYVLSIDAGQMTGIFENSHLCTCTELSNE